MITQEWSEDESLELKKIGFILNFKGYFIKDDLVLTKRLDVEFNELFYQAFDKNGMQINIPAYRIENGFINFLNSLNDLLTTDIINFDKLLNWLKNQNKECKIENDENKFIITFNNKKYSLDSLESDIEKYVLYLVLNNLIFEK